jgi:adenylosuccinate lyase
MRMRDACRLIDRDVVALLEVVKARAYEFKDTPMIGRTHGVHAEPMTFGLKLALWHAELVRDRERLHAATGRISVGKLSGAVGTFSHLPPDVEEDVCARLGLQPAPISSQVLQRDRHAEVMTTLAILAATLEKIATEIRALQKTEVRELEEPFGKKQKGSSAMPHKRNPVGCEQVTGLARLVRTNALAALENVALWHERDISHSSVERVIVPDSFLALDHMLKRMTGIVRDMAVNTERMRRNLDSTRGLVFSGQLLLELTARGMRPRRRLPRRAGPRDGGLEERGRLQAARAGRSRGARGAEASGDRGRVPAGALPAVHWCAVRARVRGGRRQERARGGQVKARVYVTLKKSVFDPRARPSTTRSSGWATRG